MYGDAVNLAARLEALNREHGTAILLCGETAPAAEDLPIEPVGTTTVRGQSVPTRLFTVRDETRELGPEGRDRMAIDEAYLRSRAGAKGPGARSRFRGRIERHVATRPPELNELWLLLALPAFLLGRTARIEGTASVVRMLLYSYPIPRKRCAFKRAASVLTTCNTSIVADRMPIT